jgi:hypothetical protein
MFDQYCIEKAFMFNQNLSRYPCPMAIRVFVFDCWGGKGREESGEHASKAQWTSMALRMLYAAGKATVKAIK